jgi:DNA-binding NarL/FixJ family response regulator
MQTTKNQNDRTILIVDDHDPFRNTLKEIISSRFSSFHCEEAQNGKDAMNLLDTLEPDLIFMDIKLPDNNGLELTRRIKEADPDRIIIVITHHDIPEYEEASFESGADYFVSKGSMNSDDIIRLIEYFVL